MPGGTPTTATTATTDTGTERTPGAPPGRSRRRAPRASEPDAPPEAAPPRVWFVRLESRLARAAVLALVGAAALALAWSAIKPGVAEWLNRGAANLAAIERAAA